MDCIFCSVKDIILENDLAFAIYDKYPVNKGHILILPKRHTADYFSLTLDERLAIDKLLFEAKVILEDDHQPDGFNIGMNCGEFAGQTVFHCHVHLIPRYKGDIDNPRGGVRGVIPAKRLY
ncbi:HIT family protein [Brevibacillus fluminis]|uniref:HIT family protein n=1 Tax=Brevibacillus fluminis TaxID=511487 RepID=UPI003F8ABA30